MSTLSLKSLLTPQKVITVDYPGYEGFSLDIAFLAREELLKLRKKCTVTKFDKKARAPVDELDSDLFVKLFIESTLKGWSGLKFKYLTDFILADVSGQDPEAELEYSPENAVVLMKNSTEIDNFVTEITGDLSNFTKYSSQKSES